jgi:glycine cleavage system H lipoate-binding protein
MRCPFLNEAEVSCCQAASVRKPIRITARTAPFDRCSTPSHRECSVYRERLPEEQAAGTERCPFLDTSLVQYCTAASSTKFVPYSDSPTTRCGGESFHYCDLYLSLAHAGNEPGDRSVETIGMPGRLYFAPNHMWLDRTDDGSCHIGIDAFLAKTLGHVERISFVTLSGLRHPAVVLTSQGVDLQLTFPNEVIIVRPNLYLRADPQRVIADPYRAGWLFEAREAAGKPAHANLRSGDKAEYWMRSDVERLSMAAHRYLQQIQPDLAGDGGTFGPDLLERLSREEILALFQDYFSPFAGAREDEAGCGE